VNVVDMTLLNEILSLTGDHKSRACWIACVNRLPEEEIRVAMSNLRLAMGEQIVSKPGGYMLRVIQNRNPDFQVSRKRKTQPSQGHDDQAMPVEHSHHVGPVNQPQPPPMPDGEPVSRDTGLRNCKIARMLIDHKITQEQAERLMNDPSLPLPG
jgi:hypothetical protein